MQRQATPNFFSAAGKHTRKKRDRLKNFCINTDHLGNTRVSFKDADGNGSIDTENEVVEVNSYYPFGLEQQKPNTTIGSTNLGQKFKYNGKEFEDDLGYNMYDYDLRHYDPAIGRWVVIDPLAEQMRRHSPYNYAFDNPIYFIDPDGMAPIPPDVITTVSNKRGDDNYVVRDINIEITLTVVNSSKADLSNTMFSKSSGNVSLENFKGLAQKHNSALKVTNQDVIKDVTVSYNVVDSLDEIGENDHVLIVANDIPTGDRDDKIDPIGIGELGGRISAVEKGTISNGSFDDVAAHEIGHNLGLEDHTGGLMNYDRDRSKMNKATNRQKGIIVDGQVTPRAGSGTYKDSDSNSNYKTPIKQQVKDFVNRNGVDY